MSFAGFNMPWVGSKEEYQRFMAKQEMTKRTANPIKNAVWRLRLKHEITIPWPTGWTPQDHLGNSSNSSDPNEWYRDWLEHQVGRQGWAWDWRVGQTHIPRDNPLIEVRDTLKIRFHKEEHAVLFALKWA